MPTMKQIKNDKIRINIVAMIAALVSSPKRRGAWIVTASKIPMEPGVIGTRLATAPRLEIIKVETKASGLPIAI